MSPQSSPEEQRNILIATVLIAVITFVWMWQITPPPPEEDQPPAEQEQTVVDSPEVRQEQEEAERLAEADEGEDEAREDDELAVIDDPTIAGAQEGTAREITVETEVYRARFSTKGGAPVSFELKEYTQFDQETPVELIGQQENGALSLAFTTPRNHNVDTRSFYFEPEVIGEGALTDSTLQVSGDSTALAFTAPVGRGHIRLVYTFYPEAYEVGLRIEQQEAQTFATSDGYEVVWHGGLPFSEDNPETEAQNAGAFARSGGDVVSLTLDSDDSAEQRLAGEVSWTAVKNKYFTAVVLPDDPRRAEGAELVGDKVDEPPFWEDYTTRLLMPAPTGAPDTYRLYLGPMDYYQIASYNRGLYDMVDYGWDFFEWMTRPLAKYFFIPIFQLLSSFIASYGIVIILLAVIVKTLVYPLTKSSYKSMAKMRELQPKMEAIKEKYGDNPQKQQEAMMKMYKETGVNPLGGCLPMLLQYPIIIALWQFLPTSIEIRQQSFLWAHDLSVPDVILSLPFTIPIYGDYVAGFTLLMGLSMIVTMQMQTSATAGGAQTKVLIYVFPFMIFFIFNQFAAGLSLYYLMYNIVTAVQQQYINKQIESESGDEAESNGRGKAADARKARRKKART